MKKIINHRSYIIYRAFTLIELLVVVSIIGILTSLVMSNMNSARERARDTQRKSDLRSIQTALRLYYNDKGRYPCHDSSYQIRACGIQATCGDVTACAWDSQWAIGTTVYMNKLPNDPLPGVDYKYTYIDDDSYTLDACLENKSDDKGQTTADTAWCLSGWMYEVKP